MARRHWPVKRLDPAPQFGVVAALALEVGGALRGSDRSDAARKRDFARAASTAMVHLRDGSPLFRPLGGAYSQCPIQEKSVSRNPKLFFQSLAEPRPRVLPVPVGHGS